MGAMHMSKIGYDDTLDRLVVAFCRDYFRREEAIRDSKCTKRTRMEYEYVNRRIADAAREVVAEQYELYISEIGFGIGYANSRVDNVCESHYKIRKAEVKISIAKKLHLLD